MTQEESEASKAERERNDELMRKARHGVVGGLTEKARNIILTTSMFVANHEIDKELDVITAECAFGMNIFRDLFAGVRDIAGGRSNATEKVLQDARVEALNQLRTRAVHKSADAVIAIDLKYVELSGGGKNGMLLVVATGTAVKLK